MRCRSCCSWISEETQYFLPLISTIIASPLRLNRFYTGVNVASQAEGFARQSPVRFAQDRAGNGGHIFSESNAWHHGQSLLETAAGQRDRKFFGGVVAADEDGFLLRSLARFEGRVDCVVNLVIASALRAYCPVLSPQKVGPQFGDGPLVAHWAGFWLHAAKIIFG
jgi:hypothetical protein